MKSYPDYLRVSLVLKKERRKFITQSDANSNDIHQYKKDKEKSRI